MARRHEGVVTGLQCLRSPLPEGAGLLARVLTRHRAVGIGVDVAQLVHELGCFGAGVRGEGEVRGRGHGGRVVGSARPLGEATSPPRGARRLLADGAWHSRSPSQWQQNLVSSECLPSTRLRLEIFWLVTYSKWRCLRASSQPASLLERSEYKGESVNRMRS